MNIEHQKMTFTEDSTANALAQIESMLIQGWSISALWMVRPQLEPTAEEDATTSNV